MAKTGNTLVALVAGAAIGVAAGMLYAPDSGEKTRKKLKKKAKNAKADLDAKARNAYDQLATEASKLSGTVNSKATELKGSVSDRLETALSSASYKADDAILALENKLEQLRAQNAKLQQPKIANEAVKKASAKVNV